MDNLKNNIAKIQAQIKVDINKVDLLKLILHIKSTKLA